MWPFTRRASRQDCRGRLAAACAEPAPGETRQPVSVSVLTTIVSPSTVESPLTGRRAAIVYIEILERVSSSSGPHVEGGSVVETRDDTYDSLGVVVLGDMVTLRDDDGDEIAIVARRARIQPALPQLGGTALDEVPAEIAPLLAKARGRGVLCFRELALAIDDRLLLTAFVEPTTSVVASGYRSGTRKTYVARDDLAPVVLDEVFVSPAT